MRLPTLLNLSIGAPLGVSFFFTDAFCPSPHSITTTREKNHVVRVGGGSGRFNMVSTAQEEFHPTTSTTTIPETSPLPPHTFAGMVEQGLLEKFDGPDDIERILTSWRLLEKDYEHKEYVGPPDHDAEQSKCHQHCHSYVPGLSIKPYWDVKEDHKLNSWTIKLQKKYKDIKDEFTKVALTDPQQLEQQGNNIWAGALTEDASSYGVDWKTLVLCDRGVWDPVNVNLFPQTAKAIRDCGVPATEVFFASMKPNSSIKPHTDFTNFVLTCHLPLVIPESGNNKCRLTIGDETRQWINGEVMVFDTSIIHDAVNESEEMRYILMLRVWHPDLTTKEREALQFTYDALNVPNLVSTEPGERFIAERQVEAMHAFPEIVQTATTSPKGFGSGGGGGAKKGRKGKKNKVGRTSSKGFGS